MPTVIIIIYNLTLHIRLHCSETSKDTPNIEDTIGFICTLINKSVCTFTGRKHFPIICILLIHNDI